MIHNLILILCTVVAVVKLGNTLPYCSKVLFKLGVHTPHLAIFSSLFENFQMGIEVRLTSTLCSEAVYNHLSLASLVLSFTPESIQKKFSLSPTDTFGIMLVPCAI